VRIRIEDLEASKHYVTQGLVDEWLKGAGGE
jgi:hypothetical protein